MSKFKASYTAENSLLTIQVPIKLEVYAITDVSS